MPYDLATVLNSIAANWNYAIPNNPDLSPGYHPVLYVAANSGVYMSTDNGQTWTLYPEHDLRRRGSRAATCRTSTSPT